MSVTFSVPGTPLEMNVANGSAAIILFDVLGYGRTDVELWGELNPSDVLRRLSVVDPATHTTEGQETQAVRVDANGVGLGCRVIECGYPLERIMRYTTTLQLMAEQAEQRGEEISYG